MTLEEIIHLKHSTEVLLADRVLDDLIAAASKSNNHDVRDAAKVLEAWDRSLDANSQGAVLFQLWVWWTPENEELFAQPFSRDDPLGTPRGLANPGAAAARLGEVVSYIKSLGGSSDVAWGDVFRLKSPMFDLPANGGADPLGVLRATYFEEQAGTYQMVANGGDSFVAAVEFGADMRAQALLSYGNFTESVPARVQSQLPLYADKKLRDVHLWGSTTVSDEVTLRESINLR
ncbi:MAG: hypothetical protein HC869_01430 [Rhodospirillales bacterium]|nr:hypothetical protein [Rhodospirillales bacterium]